MAACGTRTRYVAGCRCSACRRANLAYERRRARLLGYGRDVWEARRTGPRKADADPVRLPIRNLLRAGVGLRSIARAAGVNRKTVQGILQRSPKHRRVTLEVRDKILGATVSDATPAAGCVDASETWRLIDELLAARFTKGQIARAMGRRAPALQLHRDRVLRRNAEAVARLHRETWARSRSPPPLLLSPAKRKEARVIEVLPVDKLVPSEDNPRRELGDVAELVASICAVGILEPLVVTPGEGGAYRVVIGHRRLAAARAAGLAEVPAIVRELDDRQRGELMLIENLQREDLTPIEEASAYLRLMELGCTQRELAARVGRSQSHLSKRLSLLQLPEPALKAIDSGGISIEEALELTKLAGEPKRIEAVLANVRRSPWATVHGAVKEQLEAAERERRRLETRRELEAAGVRILKENALPWDSKIRYVADGQGSYGRMIEVRVAKHRGEPCHAALVDEHGRARYVCTDPSRHTKKGPSPVKVSEPKVPKAERERREQELAERKARDAAARARGEHIRRVLDRRLALGELVEIVAWQFVVEANHEPAERACRWLGLERQRVKTQYGEQKESPREALRRYAAAGVRELRRAALALALSLGEAAVLGGWPQGSVEKHLAFLEACGYAAGDVERARLEELRRREAEYGEDAGDLDDLAACRVCGCTEDEPCEGGCEWVPDPELDGDLCSRCAPNGR